MPREIAFLANHFKDELNQALELVNAIEHVRAYPGLPFSIHSDLARRRIELVYELAYLRIFQFWELFLEESFARYLCGYANRFGQETLAVQPNFYRTIADAHYAVRGNGYKLWHNPNQVIARCRGYITNGFHETILSSNLSRLEDFSNVRHRVAHSHDDAKRKFNTATMRLSGRRFPKARPGKFLRYKRIPTERWIETIAQELLNLARQITP